MDEEDMLLVAAGDSAAFERIVSRNQESIRCWFSSRCRSEADDLTQEVFIRVFTSVTTFQGGSFQAWLYSIANTIWIDHWRKSKRQVSTEAAGLEHHLGADYSLRDPAVLCEEADSVSQIVKLIDRLPERQAEALSSFAEGWSLRDISKILGCCVSSAKSNLRLARQKVRMSVQ